jgi:hypothetical protein
MDLNDLTAGIVAEMDRIAEIYGQSYLVRNKDGSMEVLSPQQVLVVKFHGKAPSGASVPSFRVGALGDALDTMN